ncbi:MAG: DUF11 domain-containing protein [Candidatus Saccharimonadales bacterium]
MKTIFKQMIKSLPKKFLAILLIVLIAVGVSAPAFASFGPSRPTKAWNPNVSGFDHVTFNSFTGVGNGIGDERDFFRGLQVGRDSAWTDPVSNVDHGSEVEAKIYIHNGADSALNSQPGAPGVAKNVQVRVALPTGIKQAQQATAFISADNANPGTIYDTLDFTGANNGYFALDYEAGTAELHNQDGSTSKLSDNLVTSGVNIGDQKGCFQYVREITFKMKVQMPRFNVQKQVALPGQTASDWKEDVTVKRGDTVSWLITFKNNGETPLTHVKILDQVPAGLTVVPGTVKLTNGNFLNGYIFPDSAIQANGRQINLDIGNYNPNAAGIAYVSYRTTVDKQSGKAACSPEELVNKAYATPEGFGSVNDTAKADVTAEKCATTTPPKSTPKVLTNTGPGDVAGIFTGTSLAGAFLHRKWQLRKVSR